MASRPAGSNAGRESGWCGAVGGPSGAVLPDLLGGAAGEPVQVKLREMRILSELLGFLLKRERGELRRGEKYF
jgi:hypothetical protein